jgi:periplasmic divalent cation tolerance protein
MFATVLITVPDLKTAEKISSVLIEKRLAACANYLPVKSMYRWEGEVEVSEEYILLLKTRSSDFDHICEEVVKVHPYEVPCIVRYEIAEGLRSYLDWIKESTGRPPVD